MMRPVALVCGAVSVLVCFFPCRVTFAESVTSGTVHSPTEIRVRSDGGDYALVQFDTNGEARKRYTGFRQITDVTLYDDTTFLVAEPERNTISAVGLLDGHIAWEIPVHWPRSVEVLEPDRFLVAQNHPAKVVEIDRTGKVLWELAAPLVAPGGALRLPDGNTAVVESRLESAVIVFSPAGAVLWRGTEYLRQPRGLALLPTGELATSAFDTAAVAIFRPYSEEVRKLDFCCHVEDVAVAADGSLLATTAEQQTVAAWTPSRTDDWKFNTRYPVYQVAAGPEGNPIVSIYLEPDRTCLNGAAAAARAERPVPEYFVWLACGLASALLFGLLLQWPALRRGVGAAPAPLVPQVPTRRRIEIGVYVILAVGLAAFVTDGFPAFVSGAAASQGRWYFLLWAAAALCLVLLQYRLPAEPDGWSERMSRLAAMSVPSGRMCLLWSAGLGLLGWGLYGVWAQSGEWVVAPWAAGLVLLAAGSLQPAARKGKWSALIVVLSAVSVGSLLFIRVYDLENYPANLHLDMAQWSVHTFRLLDGDSPTLWLHGYAEIPFVGHLWSGLWTTIGGRSLAGTRLAAATGGLLAIVAVFFLVRRMWGIRSAVAALVFLGFNHGFLHFSRISAYMDPIPFHVLGVLGIVAGLDTGRYGWFALAGLAGGYSALTYHAGRITPPLLALLAGFLVLRYPRAIARRLPGFVLFAICLLGMVGPYLILYWTGRMNPLGRAEVYPFLVNGVVDYDLLLQAIATGIPRVIGAFWLDGDRSTQFGTGYPLLSPAEVVLLGMAIVAALLRPKDIRGLWCLLWSAVILFIGGVLTIDPPFWPRIVTGFIAPIILAATVVGWLWRGAAVAGGRLGQAIAAVAAFGLLGMTGWNQLGYYRGFLLGVRHGSTQSTLATEWTHGILGRDIQRWGADAMMYIVAPNPHWFSCRHPTLQYYGYAADVQDAREVTRYLPFEDPRTIVVYVLPEMKAVILQLTELYPNAQLTPFLGNLGNERFVRVVIPPRPS